jgi:hypothetical protein
MGGWSKVETGLTNFWYVGAFMDTCRPV